MQDHSEERKNVMERKWRQCPNRKCPSKQDKDGGFTKVGFKTDSKKDPYYCPHCRKKLPPYVPDPDINDDQLDPDDINDHQSNSRKKFNLKEMFINMNIKKVLLGLGLVLLAAIFFSFYKVLPAILGIWGIVIIIGIAILFFGVLAALILLSKLAEKAPHWFSHVKSIGIPIGCALIIFALIVGLAAPSVQNIAGTSNRTSSDTIVATANGSGSETAATAAAPAVSSTPTVIDNGMDYPSKSWFIAKAGTVVSGDIAIFDNDNNSKKTPVYDSKEGTADIVYFTKDTYVWTEWGCYVVENATTDQIVNLINDKLGDYTVRYFYNYQKLGTNNFATYTSAVTADIVKNAASSAATPSSTTTK